MFIPVTTFGYLTGTANSYTLTVSVNRILITKWWPRGDLAGITKQMNVSFTLGVFSAASLTANT